MPTVLIVDDDLGLQRLLGISLQKYKNDFRTILANNGEEAIKVLAQHDIALLVTDLKIPKVDGHDLLAYVSEQRPEIPCILMTAHSTAEIEANSVALGFRFLNKPFTINTFVDVVLHALKPARLDGTLRGISVANFLQMIALEQKTCIIEVTSPWGNTGVLYLENGELWDAVYRNLDGEAAAFELIAMGDACMSFGELPEKAVARRIKKNVMAIIMEALQRKDEDYGYDWKQLA